LVLPSPSPCRCCQVRISCSRFLPLLRCKPPSSETRTPQTTPNWGPVRPPKLRGGISNWRGVATSNWGPQLLSSWPFEPTLFHPQFRACIPQKWAKLCIGSEYLHAFILTRLDFNED
jgi:hypothetical protein